MTEIDDATWRAIEQFNRIVECASDDFADAHSALRLLRDHLDARIEQTVPLTDEPEFDPEDLA